MYGVALAARGRHAPVSDACIPCTATQAIDAGAGTTDAPMHAGGHGRSLRADALVALAARAGAAGAAARSAAPAPLAVVRRRPTPARLGRTAQHGPPSLA